ncbi:MAG TPA: enoyl-CoA hydratase/isomerase family protein, partial [Balneolales bacterium]|nr:enoyl-CoA hydratase/isomerase family protein [Balneolales bacterium]
PLAFDFRIAAEHSRFHFNQSQFYLTPGWGGLTRLIERVGRARALEWLATGRSVTAQEALMAGLINHSFSGDQLDREVSRLGELMARNDRHLIRALKEGAERAVEIERKESLEAELEVFARLWGSAEHHKRVEEFLNRKNE